MCRTTKRADMSFDEYGNDEYTNDEYTNDEYSDDEYSDDESSDGRANKYKPLLRTYKASTAHNTSFIFTFIHFQCFCIFINNSYSVCRLVN
jgi:hypothetical protein